jgi:glycine/D-amino acid oxidase-like deaminating enzyme
MHRRTFLQLFAGASVTALPGFRLRAQAPRKVVVIGSGIIGASIAYHLARRGAEVTVCEKEGPAAGATSKSFAWINASAGKQPYHYHRLNHLSALAYKHLEPEVGGSFRVKWGGSVQWASEPEAARELRRDVAAQQTRGYPTRLIDEEAFRALEPNVYPYGPVLAAAYSREEGSIDPSAVTLGLVEAGRREGVRFEYPCEVTGLGLRWGRLERVETTMGDLEADAIVIAAGVETPTLAAMAGLRVPLRDSPGLLAHSAKAPDLLGRVVLAPSGAMKQKLDGGLVLSGGFSGVAVPQDPEPVAQEILAQAQLLIPEAEGIELERSTIGYRPLPADGHPVIGFAEGAPDVYLAVMHSGVTLSPLVGRLAASEILDDVRVEMLEPYRVERFEDGGGAASD